MKIENIIFDVDGVFTDGTFYYSDHGKIMKRFGPHDGDGIKFLRSKGVNITAITADYRGFNISQKRMADMSISLELVSEADRCDYLVKNYDLSLTCFMGDGHYDAEAFELVAYSVAPANAVERAIERAKYVTLRSGGNGAVYEAALHLLKIMENK